jgi:protein SCO1/2/putative membrane protein
MSRSWIALSTLLLLGSVALAQEQVPPRLNIHLPPFDVEREDGTRLSSTDLADEVWVADFIYTYCSGPCPAMTSAMATLQSEWPAGKPVRLVTFTVDPARDTRDALAGYAKQHGADPLRWAFVRGTPEDTAHLVRNGFKLGDPSEPVNHSTRFVLVDKGLVMHGIYDHADAADMSRLRTDLARLAGYGAGASSNTYAFFPPINATLNGAAALLLLLGYLRIRRKDIAGHRRAMLAAFFTSAAFLVCYLTYHALRGGEVTVFPASHPTARTIYYVILISHTILAVAVLPFIILSIRHGLRDNRPKHIRLARIALPVWFYVSITGVVIYFMLYQWFPA